MIDNTLFTLALIVCALASVGIILRAAHSALRGNRAVQRNHDATPAAATAAARNLRTSSSSA